MKTLKTLALCTLMALPVLNCAKKPMFEPAKSNLLEKMQAKKKKLNDKGVLAEVALGESKNLQTAINKAELEARAKITRSVESKTSSLQKKFAEEVGNDYSDHFSQAIKTISDQVISGSSLAETPFEQNGEGVYRVYGLMVLDNDLYAKVLGAQLEADKALRDRWRASRAYKELNDEIAAFQEWKKGEAMPPANADAGPQATQQGL